MLFQDSCNKTVNKAEGSECPGQAGQDRLSPKLHMQNDIETYKQLLGVEIQRLTSHNLNSSGNGDKGINTNAYEGNNTACIVGIKLQVVGTSAIIFKKMLTAKGIFPHML